MTTQTPLPESAVEIARRAARSAAAGQGDLFGSLAPAVPADGVSNKHEGSLGDPRDDSRPVRASLPRRLASVRDDGNALAQSALQGSTITSPADLGRLVRAARKRRDFSQQQFADLAGVGRRFLSELENGKPTLELGKVLKVAGAAGITLFARQG
ncbi:helix-turn-helix transcriptional regulator [Mesorhizobium sp. B2-1-3A]|uniref:helix-turn-helix transcriptional regulator n=1 Tax=Mesorhizobium sp. B2-1-3A TaxID=2589971 RepID=UPI001AEF03F6|nr:helix-turn-helix transcriptional regulator [Mesorhizobium sp. B2-1-3A]